MDNHKAAKILALDMAHRLQDKGYVLGLPRFEDSPIQMKALLESADEIALTLRNDNLALQHQNMVLQAEIYRLRSDQQGYAASISRGPAARLAPPEGIEDPAYVPDAMGATNRNDNMCPDESAPDPLPPGESVFSMALKRSLASRGGW